MSLPKVLVVDDDEGIRNAVAEMLEEEAEYVQQCDSVRMALSCLNERNFDVVVCDMYMPGATGLELIKVLNQQQRDLGFVFISGNPELPDVMAALRMHAADFLTKPFSRIQLLSVVTEAFHAVEARRQETLKVANLTTELSTQSQQLREALSALHINQKKHLEGLIVALEAREHETCAHCFRVRAYTSRLAIAANYPQESLQELEMAALLHDIGKIAVPDSILLKPDRLTANEAEFCKRHSLLGAQILESIPSFHAIASIVKHHHENWNGSGYPDHLSGESIPLGSRLFAIADTFDAITSDRCYRKAATFDHAKNEILRCRGTQFDPYLTDLFVQIPEEEWLQLRAAAEDAFFSGSGNENLSFGEIMNNFANQPEHPKKETVRNKELTRTNLCQAP